MKRSIQYSIGFLVASILVAVGITFYMKNNSPEDPNPSESLKNTEPTDPEFGRELRKLSLQDENGDILENGVSIALQQRDGWLESIKAPDGLGDDGIARINWRERGPQNVGGRTRSIIVHPDNPNIIWAGAVSGGVWKSEDGGQTWHASNGNLQNYAVNAMAINPHDPNILFAGTGEGFSGPGLIGGGLFRSTNGGESWTLISQSGPEDRKWKYINSIAISPDHCNVPSECIMLVGVEGGINGHQGILRSTDGGDTWTTVLSGFSSVSVAFDPNDGNNAVGEIIPLGSNFNRAVWSDDAGETWTTATQGGGSFETNAFGSIIRLAYHKADPSIVYAQYPTAGNGAISKSTNGGRSYTLMGSVPNDLGYYTNVLWSSPTDSSLILSGSGPLWKSTTGGASFFGTPIANGYFIEDEPHQDMQALVSDPGYNGTSNKRVYIGTDGGVFKTENITTATGSHLPLTTPTSTPTGWQQLNETYQTTQFYGAVGDASSGIIWGGTQDNGTLRLLTGSRDAIWLLSGDGGPSAIDGTNCYGTVNGEIFRTTSCGSSPSNTDIKAGISDYPNNVWLPPIVLDPNDRHRMYFGASSLWRANSVHTGSPTWVEIKVNPTVSPTPTATETPWVGKPIRISAIAVAPTNSDVAWVAEYDPLTPDGYLNGRGRLGRLYRSTNATSNTRVNWETIDDNTAGHDPLPDRLINRILVDDSDAEIVYLAFGGFEGDNLWRGHVVSGSYVWEDITGPAPEFGGLPEAPIFGIARHPNDAARIYIGTEIGVYVTNDTGAHWRPVMDGPANVKVSEVNFIQGSTILLAATYGRGLWTTDVSPGPAVNDFDGDGRTDYAVVRSLPSPSPPVWYLMNSTDGFRSQAWGAYNDRTAAADYDGDGKYDITIFRESDHNWYCLKSSTNSLEMTYSFGDPDDVLVPADFDGDGLADEAVFRPSTRYWYVNGSSAGYFTYQFGLADDVPVAADFDGDGTADFGIFRLKYGAWYLYTSLNGDQYVQFGLEGDVPVVGDYDGDGSADIAVWRPSEGTWYITFASDDYDNYIATQFGLSGDEPVPGDYDGDGKTDIAVWRPSDGTWYVRRSTSGFIMYQFGADGDIPVGRKTSDGYRVSRSFGRSKSVPQDARPRRSNNTANQVTNRR